MLQRARLPSKASSLEDLAYALNAHLRLKFEFPELIKVCERRDTYESILNEINQNLEKKIHPIKRALERRQHC